MRTTVYSPSAFSSGPADTVDLDAVERRVERIARLLDGAIAVPGTSVTIGLDAVVGLVPVVGDAAGLLASCWLILEAQRLGAPERMLRRMAFNVALDAAVGAIPLVGDVADVLFRANMRNLALIREHIALLRSDRAHVVGRRIAEVGR